LYIPPPRLSKEVALERCAVLLEKMQLVTVGEAYRLYIPPPWQCGAIDACITARYGEPIQHRRAGERAAGGEVVENDVVGVVGSRAVLMSPLSTVPLVAGSGSRSPRPGSPVLGKPPRISTPFFMTKEMLRSVPEVGL
jgi:hypothetical protein